MAVKLFTLEEASRLLPQLSDILTDLRAKKKQLDETGVELANIHRHRIRGNGHVIDGGVWDARQQELATLTNSVNRLMATVTDLGCELKDIEQGLIDFRTLRDGREVYLCWRLGEERIAYWHDLETGIAGRQPLWP